MKRQQGSAAPVYDYPFTPMRGQSHQSYTLGATAIPVYIPPNAHCILIQALTQNVRFTLDGTTPTATKGFQLFASDPPLIIPLTELTNLIVIREVSGAILEYQFGQ